MTTLDNLVRIGQLKPEPPADDEIAGYLRKASTYLGDAALEGMSSAGRFMLAYDAAHALAFAAVRSKGYRPDAARGHRAISSTAEADDLLELTLQLEVLCRNAIGAVPSAPTFLG